MAKVKQSKPESLDEESNAGSTEGVTEHLEPGAGEGLAQNLFAAVGHQVATRLSAVDSVRARILLSIDHGLLAPGDKLPNIQDLAPGLDVSTITARRALESLETDGVVVRKRGRNGGTFVAADPYSFTDESVNAFRADTGSISALIDQRLLMESTIMAEAAQKARLADCERLEELIEHSKNAETWLQHHIPDVEFHRLCAEISALPEVPTYLAVYEALTKYYVIYPQEKLESGRDDHRDLVHAFRDNDPVKAMQVTRRHVAALREEMFFALPRIKADRSKTGPKP